MDEKWIRMFELVQLAQTLTSDVEKEVEEIISLGQEQLLNRKDSIRLLTSIIESLRKGNDMRGDTSSAVSLSGDINEIVNEMVEIREELILRRKNSMINKTHNNRINLQNRNGVSVQPVFPSPWFHEKEVPMFGGFVRTQDIKLWDNNDRLDIHIHQFKKINGRDPDDRELLDIMLSKMPLPGINEKDEFKIMDLARSIANNGIRRPAIIDLDGTLLDGNRRISACYFILNSKEFTSEQKARIEYVYVWQLTEHATDDDRRRVVVSMNFEKDHKQDWPEYVKASKIYEDWQAMLTLEPYANPIRQRELKRELSQQYALGPDARYVTRYIRMFEEAEEFELFHIEERERDEYEVKHKASEYFQYFDELTKGSVKSALQDKTFRNLVYDLLFQDKFTNWKQIRDLPRIANNEDARKLLRQSRAEIEDIEEAQDKVVSACSEVQVTGREARIVGANERIENFTKFLMQLPIGSFADGTIRQESLYKLKDSLRHVNMVIQEREGVSFEDEDDELAV